MPQYVSLGQQGFFEPFQAMGRNMAALANVLQGQGQQDIEKKRLAFEQDKAQKEFDLNQPLVKAKINEAEIAARAAKKNEFLQNLNLGEAMRPVLTPTPEERAQFPGQELGHGVVDYAPPPTTGLDPQSKEMVEKSFKWTPRWRSVNLQDLDLDNLPEHHQRFAIEKVNEQAEKAGVGPISPEDISQSVRMKRWMKTGPQIPAGGVPISSEITTQPGVTTKIEFPEGGGQGGPVRTRAETLAREDELSKQAWGEFKDYNDSKSALDQLEKHTKDISSVPSAFGTDTGARDRAILSAYLTTMDPKIKLSPGASSDLAKYSDSYPSRIGKKLHKLIGKTGELDDGERAEILAAAKANVEARYASSSDAAKAIAAQGPNSTSALRIMPRIPPPGEAVGNQQVAPAQGDGTRPGTSTGPQASASRSVNEVFSSLQDFEAAARQHNWGKNTIARVYDPASKKYRPAKLQ